MLVLVSHVRAARRAEQEKASALERQRKREARVRFSKLESDARVLGTVIRHVLQFAPPELSVVVKGGRKKISPPKEGGVCRLRVGITNGGTSITTDEKFSDHVVEVLAMQESALREILFEGEPLGAAGAAVAKRQARLLQLGVPGGPLYGKCFKIFVRADVLRHYMESSPTLAALLVGEQ